MTVYSAQKTMDPTIQNLNNIDIDLEPPYEVVLYNDDVTDIVSVIGALMVVCHHPLEVAKQIAIEAHNEGRSIAFFGSKSECLQVKSKLQTLGLTVECEPI